MTPVLPRTLPRALPLLMAAPLALGLAALPALAQQAAPAAPPATPPAVLNVTGTGIASSAPDLALVTLGVTTEATAAADAMSQNNGKQTAVIDALKAAGIEARDLQTTGLRLDQRMAYPDGQAPRIEGYTAANMVVAQVRDLDGLGAALDAAIGAGATNLQGLEFQREDDRAQRDEARSNAVADALHRAQVMAEAADVTLGPIISITELDDTNRGPMPMFARMGGAAAEAAMPVEAGETAISVSVAVQFTLLPKAD